MNLNRRDFLKSLSRAGGAVAFSAAAPAVVRDALALEPSRSTGTIRDIDHIVILMQENRSFDHYFGTLQGVRGFSDRFTIPQASGKSVWSQSDGNRDVSSFHIDRASMSAAFVPNTPHTFPDAQAAWNQGRLGSWAKYKTANSMGYYTRAEIPFHYALADAFTVCDAYHCSVHAGTTVNRVAFWSGTNFDPDRRARGLNSDNAHAEILNHRSTAVGVWPVPGFTYTDSAFEWKTIPDVLNDAGVSWKFYQEPNDGWSGAMNGCIPFKSFREALPGSLNYECGMVAHPIKEFAADAAQGRLPAVSWILPPPEQSEHPARSTAPRGAVFMEQILKALVSNPSAWSRTALFITYDENDGLFDHVPPPAVPTIRPDGSMAGASTLSVAGMYCDANRPEYRDPRDMYAGRTRPWGLGPRVPTLIISP